MKTVRTAVLVALALTVAGAVLAAEKKGEKKAPPCPAAQRVDRMTEGMTLTAEQKAKLGDLCKDFGPKLMDAMKKMPVLTAEQKKAQADAMKAAKEAGKKGRELMEAGNAALKLTDEQKAQQADARKAMSPLEKELREKVAAVLTAEQKEQLNKKFPEAKKKAAK